MSRPKKKSILQRATAYAFLESAALQLHLLGTEERYHRKHLIEALKNGWLRGYQAGRRKVKNETDEAS